MARKKVTPEEEIVNTAVEGTALGSVPAGSVLHDEAGADTGDVPAELPEGDLPAEETAENPSPIPALTMIPEITLTPTTAETCRLFFPTAASP